jgi:alkyldihydroxyacetonephosphate synthase
MRRWNGWGDEATHYHLPESAAGYLESKVGQGKIIADATFDQVVTSVPAPHLVSFTRATVDPAERLCHARGQSLPDWVALRSGQIDAFPDGVAYPTSDEDIRALFDYAHQTGTHLIPYGGGTSVVGHINPRPPDTPALTVDLSRMNHVLDFDETSHLATFEAGASGPEIERQLRARGYTLGHFPQSWELSTLGGWIVTRSSGQQSYHYGRIENLFAGGHVETPQGALDLRPLPASAAGPDLRQFILGSEGRFGIVTRAIVRVQKLPKIERFYGVFFRDWSSGTDAVREITQAGIPVSMLRLSDAQETESTLKLSGKDQLIGLATRGLNMLNYRSERALLILGVTGEAAATRLTYREVMSIVRKHGGLMTGQTIGQLWRKSRFLTPYLRNTLWERGYALDTLETALPWSRTVPTALAMKGAIRAALEQFDERVLVFAHLSHVYADGASIYVTYLWRRTIDPDETLARWQAMKNAASHVVIASGGTISHQHGVGIDHAPYLEAEKGALGMQMLEAVRQSLDPEGVLNPGKLIE